MTKNNFIAAMTLILFGVIIVLGIYTVFSISVVSVYYEVLSESGLQYSEDLQSDLEGYCFGKNIFFVNENKVADIFDSYVYIDELSVRKVYPNKLVVYAEENLERFAVASEDESTYYMLDKNGVKLSEKPTNENNVDGYVNILLVNFSYDGKSFKDTEIADCMLAMCQTMNESFGGVRTNVKSITYVSPTSNKEDASFDVIMTEGVGMHIVNPLSNTEVKVSSSCNSYLSLTTEEKLFGYVTAVDKVGGNGEVAISYTSKYGVVTDK